jgi:hypothetical protein
LLIKIFLITPKAHSNSSEIFSYDLISFSVKKSFNIQEVLHNTPNAMKPSRCTPPSFSRTFQRDQKCHLKHLDLVDFMGTIIIIIINKQPSFIDK